MPRSKRSSDEDHRQEVPAEEIGTGQEVPEESPAEEPAGEQVPEEPSPVHEGGECSSEGGRGSVPAKEKEVAAVKPLHKELTRVVIYGSYYGHDIFM